MMSAIELILLAVALAMDCFVVSVVSGVIMQRIQYRTMFSMAVLFGLFQACMPLLGWLGISFFRTYLQDYDHWIAFGLLAYIGGRMVLDAFGNGEEHRFNPRHVRTQLLLAVSTSIDALAIGISFACVGYRSVGSLAVPLVIIGLVSFLFSLAGCLLGVRFGLAISKRVRPELFGGIILILIGVKILLSHLFG